MKLTEDVRAAAAQGMAEKSKEFRAGGSELDAATPQVEGSGALGEEPLRGGD